MRTSRNTTNESRRQAATLTARWMAALLLALLSSSSCGGIGGLFGVQQPTATYREFSIQSLSLEQAGFDLGFDLGNPNSFDLPVAHLDWNLDLFDQPFSFGQIRFEESDPSAGDTTADGGVLTYLGVQTLPANGTLELHTPFGVAIPDTFEGLVRIALGEDVPFAIAGTFHFDSRFGSVDVPFSQSGVLPNADVIDLLGTMGSDILDDLLR